MRVLLVQGSTPPTYWGYQYSLPFLDKGAPLPPLGLATLAAHLPESWELRIHDLHLEPVPDHLLRWADAVLLSGMLVQAASMRDVLTRARALKKPTVVGGPAVTTSPESFPEATYLFQGEAEGRLDQLVAALEHPGRIAERLLSPPGEARPSLALCRVPRFDLLQLDRYASLAVQVSRGCPFNCEFCDIIEMFGRVPRVKTPAQVLAELEALHRLGARGSLFIVDDNFIGNRKAAGRLLPEIAAWQRTHRSPFDLYTEASLDLAGDDRLVTAMIGAGFSSVFVGLETPDPETLKMTQKRQNLRMDPAEAVRRLSRAGLEVFAGFIVGFDGDDAGALLRQRQFISSLPIPRAMVGILSALPGTQLWRRLEREGRLRAAASGDQFDRTNFETTMPEEELLAGYRDLLAALFDADAFFDRCRQAMEMTPVRSAGFRRDAAAILARALWRIGIRGEPARRRWFWRLLWMGLWRGRAHLTRAVTYSIIGEHFVRYTAEEVLPRLDRRLADIRREAGSGHPQAAREGWRAALPGLDDLSHAAEPAFAGGGNEARIAAGPRADA
ncbi:MAG TPA: B12-binding domain-containing radical SAM protein [Anaeromyxobacter sp.]|nr:B12-binding domain-containing radical SAM protein [Anaeromyxobacter sp.]